MHIKNIKDSLLNEILLNKNYISNEDAKKAQQYAKDNDSTAVDYCLTESLLNKDLIGQAISEHYGLSYADLNTKKPSADQVLIIPENIAKKFRVVLFEKKEKSVIIATDIPKEKGILLALKKIFKEKIEIRFSLSEDIDDVLNYYRKPLLQRLEKIIESKENIATSLVAEIFDDAIILKSSDIHFEPVDGGTTLIRFRVDGVLRKTAEITKDYYKNIINLIKVKSNLRIDEHFVTQDGSMRYDTKKNVIDMRISIAPTLNGEKIVIRILNAYVQDLGLGDIGFSSVDKSIIQESIKKPYGMILVTGPTGSGKTTTLYSLIKILNRADVNITTIEDPVEYRIKGVNQIQVNRATELTFAKGLRSIVRQDPDIILVGEIRDAETADISVNAALTGHLLFSTFHANDSATTIPRLINMGVEPFLLASTLEAIIAQRLVRKICDSCRHSVKYTKNKLNKEYPEFSRFVNKKDIVLYSGKGCDKCGGTGYIGRTAIFEIIKLNKELRNLILSNPSSDIIWDMAKKYGSRSLFEDGVLKVLEGQTTVEELLRIAKAQ